MYMKFGKFHQISEKQGSRTAERAYDRSVDKAYVDKKISDLRKEFEKSGGGGDGSNHYTVVPGEGLGGDSETLLVVDLTVGAIVGRLSARGRLVSHPVVFDNKVGFTVARNKTLMGTIHELPSGALVDQFRVQGGGDMHFEPIFQRKDDIDKALAKQLKDPNSAFGKNIGDYRRELEHKLKQQRDVAQAFEDDISDQEETFDRRISDVDRRIQRLKSREDKIERALDITAQQVDKSEGAERAMSSTGTSRRPRTVLSRVRQILGATPEDPSPPTVPAAPQSQAWSPPPELDQALAHYRKASELAADDPTPQNIIRQKEAEFDVEAAQAAADKAQADARAQGKYFDHISQLPKTKKDRYMDTPKHGKGKIWRGGKSKTTPALAKAAADSASANVPRKLGDKKGSINT